MKADQYDSIVEEWKSSRRVWPSWGGGQPPTGTTFRILALDGGGIRGALAASFLARVEEKLNISIAEHFDLIAGTSTGVIIAVALAMGLPAARIQALYREHGLTLDAPGLELVEDVEHSGQLDAGLRATVFFRTKSRWGCLRPQAD
jgi:predicted acylesterase/phospholipase RssA